MKRPASQYYWGDWRRDTALQGCSLAARGLWHEMNCLMHDCEPYGHLTVGEKPMAVAKLARLVGIGPKECTELLAELDEAQIYSVTDAGVIYSRRMVRDEDLRERRAAGGQAGAAHGSKGAEYGKKGGRPPTQKGGSETPLDPSQEPPPAFASASATAKDLERAAAPTLPPLLAPGGSPPEAKGHEPTPAGGVCRAMRAVGLAAVNPGDPRLLALLEQGATEAEFVGIAEEAVKGRKGWAWVLTVLQARRAEAADISLAPPPADPMAWRRSELGLRRMAKQLRVAERDGESFPDFDRRVLAAWHRAGDPPESEAA